MISWLGAAVGCAVFLHLFFDTLASSSISVLWRWASLVLPFIVSIAFFCRLRSKRDPSLTHRQAFLEIFSALCAQAVLLTCTQSAAAVSDHSGFFLVVAFLLSVALFVATSRGKLTDYFLLLSLVLGSLLFVPTLGPAFQNPWYETIVLLYTILTVVSVSSRSEVKGVVCVAALLFAWLLWLYLTTWFSVSGEESVLGFIRYTFVILLGVAAYRHVVAKGSADVLIRALLYLNLSVLGLFFWQFTYVIVSHGFYDILSYRLWLNGVNPTHTAQFFAAITPVLFACYPRGRGVLTGRTLLVSTLVGGNLFALLLTYNRSSLLALLFGLALLVLFRFSGVGGWQRKRGVRVAVVVAALVAGALLVLSPLGGRWKESGSPLQALQESGRLYDYSLSTAMISKRPVGGFGLGTRPHVAGSLVRSFSSDWMPMSFSVHSHNLFLGLASETGLVGLGLFLLLLACIGPVAIRGREQPVFFCSAVVLVIALQFGALLYDTLALLAVLLGAAMAVGASERRSPQAVSVKDQFFVHALLAASFLTLLFSLGYLALHKTLEKRNVLSRETFTTRMKVLGSFLPFSSVIPYNLATTAVGGGELHVAQTYLQEAVAKSPYRHPYYFALAFVQRRLGDLEGAFQTVERGIHFRLPTEGATYLRAAEYAVLAGDVAKGVYYLKAGLRRTPGSILALGRHGFWALHPKLIRRALHEMESEVEQRFREGNCPRQILYPLCRAYLAAGMNDDLVRIIRGALHWDSHDPYLLAYLLGVYRNKKEWTSARKVLEEVAGVDVVFGNSVFLNEAALIAIARGDFSEAIKLADASLVSWRDRYVANVVAMMILADAYRELKDQENLEVWAGRVLAGREDLSLRIRRSLNDRQPNPEMEQIMAYVSGNSVVQFQGLEKGP